MKFFLFVIAACFMFSCTEPAFAQSSAQQEAVNMAILYAVLNKKMKDEDIAKDLDSLRNNKKFIARLEKRLEKLSNSKNADAKNRKIRKILQDAGKEIDKSL